MSKLSYEDKINLYDERKNGCSMGILSKKYNIAVHGVQYLCCLIDKHGFDILRTTKNRYYPVYIDTEDNHNINKYSEESQYSIGKERLTEIIRTYCAYLEEKKYYVGIYASLSWLYNQLDLEKLTLYDKWVAQWAPSCTYEGSYGMWQYTNKGEVADLVLDMNERYYNFEKIIKERNLNGFVEEEVIISEELEKPNEDVKKLKVGDKVKIIATGKSTSYGTGKTAKGIGWERQILGIYLGRDYPYRVGNSKGTTGFYKEEALKRVS